MITRIKLPSEDGFLDGADDDRSKLYKTKEPVEPTKCGCHICPPASWSMVMSGIFLYKSVFD
jgi:hypothetical protein